MRIRRIAWMTVAALVLVAVGVGAMAVTPDASPSTVCIAEPISVYDDRGLPQPDDAYWTRDDGFAESREWHPNGRLAMRVLTNAGHPRPLVIWAWDEDGYLRTKFEGVFPVVLDASEMTVAELNDKWGHGFGSEGLYLRGNQHVTASQLCELLGGESQLRFVNLLDTPQIKASDMPAIRASAPPDTVFFK